MTQFERLCDVEDMLKAENDRSLAQLADLRAAVRDHITAHHDHVSRLASALDPAMGASRRPEP